MTTTLIVNIALDVAASAGVVALAAWAIRTGERDPGRLGSAARHCGLEAERAATA